MDNQKNFKTKVLAIVRKIPKGKTLTYSDVARRAGSPNAARAVGSILKQNANTDVPCHRVIRRDGLLGGYNGLLTKRPGTNAKLALLRKEGVKI